MTADSLIIGLAILNLFQFIFWGWQNQTLINKLMSKDFAEYKLVKDGPPKIERFEEVDLEAKEAEDEYLRELNGMLPTIRNQ